MYIGFQIYPFIAMYKAKGMKLDIAAVLKMCHDIGYTGWESFLDLPELLEMDISELEQSPLAMKTAYINLVLHERDRAESEVARATDLVTQFKGLGLEYLVVNPSPISWSEDTTKTDDQLSQQLEAFNTFGLQLKEMGVNLAYHAHSSEMRAGAKEQFHMLLNTDPKCVSWSLDCDWIYQGTDKSATSVYNWIEMFGDRVSILHARQITNGIWHQRFEDGDIDYPAVMKQLNGKGVSPILVNEQIPGDPIDAFEHMKDNYEVSRRNLIVLSESSPKP